MSLEDLAVILGVSPSFLGLVERGHRGTDISKLAEITKVFNISLDSLIIDRSKEELTYAEPKYNGRATIYSLTYDLKAQELDFLISVIRALKKSK